MFKARHILFILISLFVILGIPAIFFGNWSNVIPGGSVDTVSGASLNVPDQPSGNFLVFVNKTYHSYLDDWYTFFTEQPVGVIFEDISCQIYTGDVSGTALAERYQARLAENQMKIRREANSQLLTGKIENGIFDIAIFSQEMADAFGLERVFSMDSVMTIRIRGKEE